MNPLLRLGCAALAAWAWLPRATQAEEPAGLAALRTAFAEVRWVAYTPSDYRPIGQVRKAEEAGLRADLAVLRPHFDGLVTYSCNPAHGLGPIVPLAAELDFRVILGVWDVKSVSEIATAVALARAHPRTILGLLVGNETLLRGGKFADLEQAVQLVRAALPGVPVSTSEPIGSYGDEALRMLGDFHAPTIHWIFQGGDVPNPAAALAWLKNRTDALRELRHGDRPLLLKEHGLPSAPAPFSEAAQREYWALAAVAFPRSPQSALVFFEGFDLPWKVPAKASDLGASEAHWGAWTQEREPKPVVEALEKRPGR